MNPFAIFNRHPASELSAYIDGQVKSERRATIERHVDGCASCRSDVAELRVVMTTMGDLPLAAAPRSFALTPNMVARPVAASEPRSMPGYVGMRIAGAGVAAVLAVVVLLDAGGVVNESGSGDDSGSTALNFAETSDDAPTGAQLDMSEYDEFANDLEASASPVERAGGAEETKAPEPTIAPGSAPADATQEPAAGGIGGALDGENATTTPDEGYIADAPVATDPVLPVNADDSDAAATDATLDNEALRTVAAGEDNGISTLVIIEIALAVFAAAAVAGSFVLAYAVNRGSNRD
ncbi:MAG: zf-HC2 domain-containing protein [Dehalococcoidia bacterium]